MCVIQEKQLKKVRAKQKRLQAILGGEITQRFEDELLAEGAEGTGKLTTTNELNSTEVKQKERTKLGTSPIGE